MNRLVVFRIIILIVFAVMTTRLWGLQIKQGAALSQAAEGHTVQRIWERPLRGEIFASDGQIRLAESLPAYTISVRPSQLPSPHKAHDRNMVWARLDDILHLSTGVVVSPTTELRYVPGLRTEVEKLGGPLPPGVFATPAYTVTVPAGQALQALQVTEHFSTTLHFASPSEARVTRLAGAPYETVPLTTTRSLDLALMVKENSTFLPGVAVERDYQRSYPHSGEVQSLSHVLGYVGDIDMCDIIRRDPPGMYASYGKASEATCGIEPGETLTDSAPVKYLLNDRIGRDGLERTYEDVLRGKLGQQQVEIDVNSRLVAEPQVVKPTENGQNLVLTINYDLQKQTETIVRKWIAEAERRRQHPAPQFSYQLNYTPIEAGVAIALEIKTGRILAMVSWPAFDNNIFNRTRDKAEVDQIFNPPWPHPAPAIDQAISGLFPPGSTWKQISASTALEGGAIGPDTRVHDPGVLMVKNQYYDTDPRYDERFPNSFGGDRGYTNVIQALQFSSNVFFQSVIGGTKYVRNLPENDKLAGYDPSGEKLAQMAQAYGFGAPTGIDLPGEASGQVPSKSWKANLPDWSPLRKEPWNVADIYNTVIGQGNVLVTPLQLALASAALANGGSLYKPQLVQRIVDGDGKTIREIAPELHAKVPLSASTVNAIHEGMHLAVDAGFDTCGKTEISGIDIAGKTGTAEYTQLIDPNKPYSESNLSKRSHAWFAGFAPYNNPEIEVLSLVEGAGDMGDGSATITVPLAAEIMQAYYHVTPPQPSFGPVPPYNLPCH